MWIKISKGNSYLWDCHWDFSSRESRHEHCHRLLYGSITLAWCNFLCSRLYIRVYTSAKLHIETAPHLRLWLADAWMSFTPLLSVSPLTLFSTSKYGLYAALIELKARSWAPHRKPHKHPLVTSWLLCVDARAITDVDRMTRNAHFAIWSSRDLLAYGGHQISLQTIHCLSQRRMLNPELPIQKSCLKR